MPVNNGFDVLHWLRGHDAFKSVVVFMISVSDAPSDRSKAQELGAQGFLSKYPSTQTLEEILDLLTLPPYVEKKWSGLPSTESHLRRNFNRL